jgi:hypothetical protein
MRETQRARRGHDFLPPPDELAGIPGDGGTSAVPLGDKIIRVHYFGGPADCYLAEMWQDEDTWRGFGYTTFSGIGGGDWGDVGLEEMEQVRAGLVIIERDLYWDPVPFWRLEHRFDDFGYDYIVKAGRALGHDPGQIAADCRDARDQEAPLTALQPAWRHDPASGGWQTLAVALADWDGARLARHGLGAADVPAALGELARPLWLGEEHSGEQARVRAAILSRFPQDAAGATRRARPGSRPARPAAAARNPPVRRPGP